MLMTGAIISGGAKHHTDLAAVFAAIGDAQLGYNWLVTDCLCYPHDANLEALLARNHIWLPGALMTQAAQKAGLFDWVVFSGFKKDIAMSEVLEFDLPFADGYSGFWDSSVTIQHPLADIEIVAWDGTQTLLISRHDALVQKFISANPLAQDLAAYNAR